MYDNSFSNFGRPPVPDDSCKGSAPRHSRFWRRRFYKGFYHIWVWRPSWSTDRDHYSNFSFPHPKEAPYEILAKLAQRLQRKSHLKMLTDGRRDGRTDGRTDIRMDRQKVITIAHPEQSSGQLKKTTKTNKLFLTFDL